MKKIKIICNRGKLGGVSNGESGKLDNGGRKWALVKE